MDFTTELPTDLPAQPVEAPTLQSARIAFRLNDATTRARESTGGMHGYPAIEPYTLCFFAGTVSARLENRNAYLVDGVAINGVSGGPVFHCVDSDQVQIIGCVSAYTQTGLRAKPYPAYSRPKTYHTSMAQPAGYAALMKQTPKRRNLRLLKRRRQRKVPPRPLTELLSSHRSPKRGPHPVPQVDRTKLTHYLGARNVENLRHSGYEEFKDHRAKHYVTGESPLSDCVLGHQLSLASLPAMVFGQSQTMLAIQQCNGCASLAWNDW